MLARDVAREVLVPAPCVLGRDHDDRAAVAHRGLRLLDGAHHPARVDAEDVVPDIGVERGDPGPRRDDPRDGDEHVDVADRPLPCLRERRPDRRVVAEVDRDLAPAVGEGAATERACEVEHDAGRRARRRELAHDSRADAVRAAGDDRAPAGEDGPRAVASRSHGGRPGRRGVDGPPASRAAGLLGPWRSPGEPKTSNIECQHSSG